MKTVKKSRCCSATRDRLFLPLFGALSFLSFLSSDLAAMVGVSWAGFWLYLLYGYATWEVALK